MKPTQRVIIYQGVAGPSYAAMTLSRSEENAARNGADKYVTCTRCERKVRRTKSGLLKQHYESFRDRIRCPNTREFR